MPEFLKLIPRQQALQILLTEMHVNVSRDCVSAIDALGRVTAESIYSPIPLPTFPRSTVDGYAVRAADTFGASESLPAYLVLAGEVPMGLAPQFALAPMQVALIHTGGMLPQGADAVIMVEMTQVASQGEIEVLKAVAV